MRIEAAKASGGAVLRQQVFYFDSVPSNNGGDAGANLVLDFGNGNGSSGASMATVSSAKLGGSNYRSSAPAYAKVTAPGGIIPVNYGAQPGNPVLNMNVAGGGLHPAMHTAGGARSAAGGSKQEELLRQLFPSWF